MVKRGTQRERRLVQERNTKTKLGLEARSPDPDSSVFPTRLLDLKLQMTTKLRERLLLLFDI